MADEAGIPLAGAIEQALTAVAEAVKLQRGIVATRPGESLQARARADLATALNNQSAMLSGAGRSEDALAAVEEAVEIRRRLAAKRPDVFEQASTLADLASSLNNQSLMLSGLGRREEAGTASEEAVEIYRRLAAKRADKFSQASALADLATARPVTNNGTKSAGKRLWGPIVGIVRACRSSFCRTWKRRRTDA
ncbi:MAG: tetratricopeptide repeat protein, partial [Actinomycetota bacterium]|nr:tetratricopeptide repeat protein [Actinomycetota bacterium]